MPWLLNCTRMRTIQTHEGSKVITRFVFIIRNLRLNGKEHLFELSLRWAKHALWVMKTHNTSRLTGSGLDTN